MRSLAERVRTLQSVEVEHLMAFHNPKLGGFVVDPQHPHRVSVLSTCNVVRAMLTNKEPWAKVFGADIDVDQMLTALLDAQWAFDPLQTPVALAGIISLQAGLPDHPKAHLALAHTCLSVFRSASLDPPDLQLGTAGVVDEHSAAGMPISRAALLEGREALNVGALVPGEDGRPPPSAYLRYQCAHALCELVKRAGWQPTGDAYLSPRMGEIRAALERAAIDAYRSLCEQMALRAARADEGSDPVRLTYDLCTYYEAASVLQKSTGIFAKPTRAPKVNLKLTAHILGAIFALQKESGLWPKGEPIASRFPTRDLGNSFVFSFDMLGELLMTIGEEQPALFREHLFSIERAVSWAESSIVESSGTAAWYAAREPDAPQEMPPGVTRGWRSSHLTEAAGPLCWSSAQVYSALSSARCLLRKLSAETVLSEFRATRVSERSTRLFDSLMDSEVQLAAVGNGGGNGEGDSDSLKRILLRDILEPLADAPAGRPFQEVDMEKSAKFSAILYGPPGTAKSTVCEAVARHLGWPLLTIDTADLLAAGLEQVAGRMTYIFEKLIALERTVILFDEIEEFCLDRSEGTLSMESRMLTTAMLTQLNDLRRKQRCVFFVATNRITAFDMAVTRPGRFDMILMVGTPSLKARVDRLNAKLAGCSLGKQDSELREVLTGVLKDTWTSELQFFNFMENEQLLNALVNAAAKAAAEGRTPMSLFAESRDIITSLASRIVLRGGARDEYVSSRALSRV